ncbi:retrovirus-related Pol polyprotein from transposon TNT 1-94 [Trichonephila clavipes]|nr:retrovirus-related Pol polyprotein from transposon TNT 1-94 [Trichonephila clavipes]
MDDNATCYRTFAVQDCLDSEGIQRLVWPARSPDLNPIENVWDALGRQVAGRNYLPTNKNTLIRTLTEEWDILPQQLLDNVVQSMVRRVECCITLHGGHIPTLACSTKSLPFLIGNKIVSHPVPSDTVPNTIGSSRQGPIQPIPNMVPHAKCQPDEP